ncbi:MAG: ABC transporter substrate-binding protein [Alphaproteobacteria bacterium]|nr:ABC transporter substrate-binding protein [Alphaproteobacteria bacterium]
MRRRALLLTALSAAALRPAEVHAQSGAPAIVGFLSASSAATQGPNLEGFRKGLAESGFVEGRNLTIEQRWAEGDYARLPALAAELVALKPAALAAGGPPAARAAKAATTTIPIVFTSGEDPVKAGFVESLGRPGGNMTGATINTVELAAKRLELAREIVPRLELVAIVIARTAEGTAQAHQSQEAARHFGIQIVVFEASTPAEIDQAFESAARQKVGFVIIGADPFISVQIPRAAALAKRFHLPAVYFDRQFPKLGGLMSYGASAADAYHKIGLYAARILRGAKPADLPVQQPTKFDLVINAVTAKELGLAIPPPLLAFADEVIE